MLVGKRMIGFKVKKKTPKPCYIALLLYEGNIVQVRSTNNLLLALTYAKVR